MAFLLTCPHCGAREATDFGYGGEVSGRPSSNPSFRELNAYNYFRRNRAGVQREWWCHRSGCRAWFVAERNTLTNEVLFTALPHEALPGRARAAEGPHEGPSARPGEAPHEGPSAGPPEAPPEGRSAGPAEAPHDGASAGPAEGPEPGGPA